MELAGSGCNLHIEVDILLERAHVRTKVCGGEWLDVCVLEYLTGRFVFQVLRMLTVYQLSKSKRILPI